MLCSDLNLLFGILALQLNFITRQALISAMNEWVLNKERSLGEILQANGQLALEPRQLLDALVKEHLRQHAGDAQRSLAAISSMDSVRDDLYEVADSDLHDSMSHLPQRIQFHPNSETLIATQEKAKSENEVTASATGFRFRILRPHARGGLGQVSVALDKELNREVALKEIQSEHADDTDSRSRFLLEAEITGRLEHPGIVPVYGLGHYADGRPFYAMRFIQGDSLKAAIHAFHQARMDENGTVTSFDPTERNVQFRHLLLRFVDVCNTMAYAHSRGILHRDLKPGNIMVGKYGETLVVDWGLAKPLDRCKRTESLDVKEPTLIPATGGSSETLPGRAIGTPGYMSPEQAAGKLDELGPASDVYSLGATLYHLLTGQAPFSGNNIVEILQKVKRGEYTKPTQLQPGTPRELEAVCLRAMCLRPEDRYASPKLLAEDIELWLADEPIRALREGVVARGARWIRKHRAWTMSGAAALALVAIVSTFAAVWINQQNGIISQNERDAKALASRNATLAREKSKLAEQEKSARETSDNNAIKAKNESLRANQNAADADRQTKRVKRNLYIAHMNLAQVAWEKGLVSETVRLLGLYRPTSEMAFGPEDLRRFEWFYWDRLCHSELFKIEGNNGEHGSIAYSPDGQRLASACFDRTIKVWDVITGKLLTTMEGHAAQIACVTFSSDGKLLASAAGSKHDWNTPGELFVWDANTGKIKLDVKGHPSYVTSVAFSPDGNWLASTCGGNDQSVRIWNAQNGDEKLTRKGGTSDVVFSPDGKLVSSFCDGVVKFWNPITGQEEWTLNDATSGAIFSPDGKHVACGCNNQSIKILDAKEGRVVRTLHGYPQGATNLTFSADWKQLAFSDLNRTVKIWDALTGRELLKFKGASAHLVFSPDRKRLSSACADDAVRVWDAICGQEMRNLNGDEWAIPCMAIFPDGKRTATGNWKKAIKIWDLTSGRELFTLSGHTGGVNSVAVSPDSNWMASASEDHTVIVWNAMTGKVSYTKKGYYGSTTSVAFSPDGKLLASGSRDETVKIWNVASGEEIHNLRKFRHSVECLAFSPDGTKIAAAGNEPTITLWDAVNGKEIRSYPLHAGGINHVAFSPKGTFLASASDDQTVKILNLANGQIQHTLRGHTGIIKCLAYAPDGSRLASGSGDGTVKLWDTENGLEVLTLDGNDLTVFSIMFTPNGERLISTTNVQKVWDARPWTPEMRVEREALSVITFLRESGRMQTEWLDAISSDRTISESVRRRALQFDRNWDIKGLQFQSF